MYSELSDSEDHVASINSNFTVGVEVICAILFLHCDFGGRGEHRLRYNN